MASWQGILQTTLPKYLKGASDQTLRNRIWLSKLKKDGRIKYNNSGESIEWRVNYRENELEVYTDGAVSAFERINRHKTARITWVAYRATDLMTELEKKQYGSDVGIINRYKEIVPMLLRDAESKFSGELFIDGLATGNEGRLHGLETFLGNTTTVDADISAHPSDTYAGISTAPGTYGGTWSSDLGTAPNANLATDWPHGSGDPEYDFWSPKLVNYASSSGWGTSSSAWKDNCEYAMRHGLQWCTQTGGKNATPGLILMTGKMFAEFKDKQATKERINMPHPEAIELGFPGAMSFEGAMVMSDFDVPVDTAYMINTNQMELLSMSPDLFGSKGPDYDIGQDAYRFAIGFFGNMKYHSPKHFGKLKNYA